MIRTSRALALVLAAGLLGMILGGWLFAKSQPRSVLAWRDCDHCWTPSDLAGLLASAGIARFSDALPLVALQSERTIVFRIPQAHGVHYVLLPKRDIEDIGRLQPADADDMMDLLLTSRRLIERDHLRNYRLCTNGPGFQDVRYLHFHLVGS